MKPYRRARRALLPGLAILISLAFSTPPCLGAGALPEFDFKDATQAASWSEPHHLAGSVPTDEGLALTINGNDPWIVSPPRDFPAGTELWLRLRLKSDQPGTAQIFHYPATGGATEPDSVRFNVRGGVWDELKVRLPALGPGYRFRFDPPGTRGQCVLGRLWFEERRSFAAPDWPRPVVPERGVDAVSIESGDLRLVHNRGEQGGFLIEVGGRQMAVGNTAALVGYVRNGASRWFRLNGNSARVQVEGQPLTLLADAQVGGVVRSVATCTDPDGGQWRVEQAFRLNASGTLQFEASARCDQDREVLYLPLLTLFPGLGSYGTNKTQALFAGIEYLENEPSSSTADLNPPGSNRQVPDTARLTFPLMAVAAEGRYLAVAWNQPVGAQTCAVFDTPDRLLGSGAQLMGLVFPGSDGLNREEHSLLPYGPVRVPADRSVRVNGLLLGGAGSTVVPAVQAYVHQFGLPPLPQAVADPQAYLTLAARGWLDSRIRDGDLYRHAAPGFGSIPAADAALFQDWIARCLPTMELAPRLVAAAQAARSRIPEAELSSSQVGHIRYPAPNLVYGGVSASLARAERHGRALLGRFEKDGFVRFRKSRDGLDYGRTHGAPDANGLTAQVLSGVLREAAFTGDPALIESGLKHLRALTERYQGGVPRGAQTWEIPLHTPDILASAYLVECYVMGFELTGERTFLDQARYWAWTGVPFTYLQAPVDGPIGLYATTPVLGATQWVAPNWIGLPVQWCGLVFAEALHCLARHDPDGPWRQLADGIVLSGIQQTYPAEDADDVGLLPDSFNLRGQTRNPANINPATLLAPAIRTLGLRSVYDFRALAGHGLRVHAPGEILEVQEVPGRVGFKVRGWPGQPWYLLVNGLSACPEIRVNDRPVAVEPPHEYQVAAGRLILQLEGEARVELEGIGKRSGRAP